MTYEYQTTQRYFVQVADDLAELAGEELRSLGAGDVATVYRGLRITADPATLYRVNLHSRLVNRVLAPLATFDCHSDRYLYKRVKEIPWEDFLTTEQTLAVFAQVSHSRIKHSRYAALKLKDAVVDRFRDRTGRRPSVDTRAPDLWINLHLDNNRATVSLDTSGGSLHRRGYRRSSVEAPMIETLAAAVVCMTGWEGASPLYDPLCGSGTLLCEAFLLASKTPAGFLRDSFGFERLPDFDPGLWDRVRQQGLAGIRTLPPGLISGSDRDPEAVQAARQNCSLLDHGGAIQVARRDMFDIPALEDTTIVCNPPYGIRLGNRSDLGDFYKRLGDFLKQRCTGSTAFIYFGDRTLLKSIGLRPTWKKPLRNAGLDGRLARFELY
mgnify:CR=1 FL=1